MYRVAYQRNQLVVFYGVDRYEWRYNQQAVSCFFKSLVQNLDMLFCGGQTKGGVVGAQRNFLLVNKVVGNLVGWIIEKAEIRMAKDEVRVIKSEIRMVKRTKLR